MKSPPLIQLMKDEKHADRDCSQKFKISSDCCGIKALYVENATLSVFSFGASTDTKSGHWNFLLVSKKARLESISSSSWKDQRFDST